MIGKFYVTEQDAAAKMAAIMAACPELFEDRIYVHYDFEEESGEVTLYDDCTESKSSKSFPCGAIGCPERDDDIYEMDDQDEADAQYAADVDAWMQDRFPAVWQADSAELIAFCGGAICIITR